MDKALAYTMAVVLAVGSGLLVDQRCVLPAHYGFCLT